MHVPENWLVESVRSPYDLDNIKLDEVLESIVHRCVIDSFSFLLNDRTSRKKNQFSVLSKSLTKWLLMGRPAVAIFQSWTETSAIIISKTFIIKPTISNSFSFNFRARYKKGSNEA